MASPYRGRVEWGTTGIAKIEIDDLDSTTWRGVPSNGGVLVRGSETYPWLVGVILLEGPRAGEYATADLVVEDDPVSMRFEGRSAFASTLSEKDLGAAKARADRRDEQLAMMRSPVPRADGQPVFHDVRVSALDRPRRNTDVLPEQMEHMAERIPIDPGSIRLALEHDDHRVYLARGIRDGELCVINIDSRSGGASCGPLSNLATFGVTFSTTTGSHRSGALVHGAVPDEVIAVRVDDVHAVMGENAFVAVMPDGPPIGGLILMTQHGNVEVPLRSPLEPA